MSGTQHAAIADDEFSIPSLAKRRFSEGFLEVSSFFSSLTRRRLQRVVFRSLVDLQATINRYLGEYSRKPKPFVWTADPDRIIQ